jgi:hypothetical protein
MVSVGRDHLGGTAVDAGHTGGNRAGRQLGGAEFGPAEQRKIVRRQRNEAFDSRRDRAASDERPEVD